jgi:hypothetical protein
LTAESPRSLILRKARNCRFSAGLNVSQARWGAKESWLIDYQEDLTDRTAESMMNSAFSLDYSSARASNVGGSRENGAATAQKAHEKNESLRQLWSYFPTLAIWSEIATASELRKAADYGKERLVLLRRFPLEQALGLPSIIGKFSVLRVMRMRARQLLERSMASAE